MRRAISFFSLLSASFFLTGCISSTLCLEQKKDLQHFYGGSQPVFVTNPQMHPEYEILKASEIYHLTNQPTGACALTLHPIREYGRCGNPLLLTLATFGLVPGYLPANRTFEYDLNTNGVAVTYIHCLPLYERYSDWEWLVRRSDEKAMTDGLAWSARQQRLPNFIY